MKCRLAGLKKTLEKMKERKPITCTKDVTPCIYAIMAKTLMEQQDYQAALDLYDRSLRSCSTSTSIGVRLTEKETCRSLLDNSMRYLIGNFIPALPSKLSYAKYNALLRHEAGKRNCQHTNEQIYASDDLLQEQEILIQAYSLLYGWGTTKNVNEAFAKFLKAESGITTTTEAKFQLAQMMYNGHGTEKNTEYAITKFVETALSSHLNPADVFNKQRNVGVAESRHFLGSYFNQSVKSETSKSSKNPWPSYGTLQLASLWFEMGYQCQSGLSSTSLANLYIHGGEIPYNDATAEFYWKAAIAQKHYVAYIYLVNLYIVQQEYIKAEALIKSALNIDDVKVTCALAALLKKVKSGLKDVEMCKEDVELFEDRYQLDGKGFTLFQRLERMKNVIQYTTDLQTITDNMLSGEEIYVSAWNDVEEKDPCYLLLEEIHLENLCWRNAIQESEYTREMIETLIHYCRLTRLLDRYAGNKFNLTKIFQNACEFVFLLRDLLKLNPFVIKWNKRRLSEVFSILMEINKNDFRAESAASNLIISFTEALEVCLAEIGLRHDPHGIGFKFFINAWTMYPEQIQLSVTFSDHLASNQDYGRAYMVGAEALERFPKHIDLLYSHGHVCLGSMDNVVGTPSEMRRKALKYFVEFLSLAPYDHPKIPEAYYTIGKIYHDIWKEFGGLYRELSIAVVKHFLLLGEVAEQNLLLCFIPYQSPMKDSLNTILLLNKGIGSSYNHYQSIDAIYHSDPESIVDDDDIGNVNEPKISGNNVIELTASLRDCFMKELVNNRNSVRITTEFTGNRIHTIPISTEVKFRPITIQELVSVKYKIWENRVLVVTVIDEAFSGFGYDSIHVIAKDRNKDVVHVMLQYFKQDASVQQKYGFGCELHILQPTTTTIGGECVLLVQDPNAVVCGKRDKGLCRYCFAPNAAKNCSRCKWANYCNKRCQAFDWKILKHKNICYSSPPWYVNV